MGGGGEGGGIAIFEDKDQTSMFLFGIRNICNLVRYFWQVLYVTGLLNKYCTNKCFIFSAAFSECSFSLDTLIS